MNLQDSSPLPLLKLDPERMSEGPSLEVSNTESWNQERITPTVARKSTGSSFDLFFTAPYLSFEPGAQQPNGLRLIQPVLAIHEELQLGVCGWSNTGLPLHQYSFLKYLQSPTIFYFSPHLLPPGLLTNNLSMVRNIHMCRLWIKQEYTSCVGSEQHGQSLLLCLDLMMDGDNICVPETSLKLQQESDHTH